MCTMMTGGRFGVPALGKGITRTPLPYRVWSVDQWRRVCRFSVWRFRPPLAS